MSPNSIGGVWAASITPLRDDLSVDHQRLADHAAGLLSEGCTGVVLFGTTGEAPSFTVGERMISLDTLLGAGIPPDRLVVGTGCPSLGDTVALTRHASANEVAGVLVMPPYLFKKPSEAGVVTWYRRLLDDSADTDPKLYLYHYPALSGVDITSNLIAALVESHPDLVKGIKDSSGDLATLERFLEHARLISVMPGTERLMQTALAGGGAGVITAGANVNAAGIAQVAAGVAPDRMLLVRDSVDQHGGITAIKACLAVDESDNIRLVRPPLMPLDWAAAERARTAIRAALE